MSQKKDPEDAPDGMENVLDEEDIDLGFGGKYNEDITGEGYIDKIDINSSSKEDLMKIPGIKESTAELILNYRKTKKIQNIDDLKDIITNKELEILKNWCKIN